MFELRSYHKLQLQVLTGQHYIYTTTSKVEGTHYLLYYTVLRTRNKINRSMNGELYEYINQHIPTLP